MLGPCLFAWPEVKTAKLSYHHEKLQESWWNWWMPLPKQSMHSIFTYLYHNFKPNVGKYTSPMDVWVISNNRNTCTCLPRFNVSQRPKDESVSKIGATFKTCVPTNKFLLTHTTHFFPKTVFVGSQKITVQIVSRSFCKTLNVPYISLTTNQPQGILPKQ